MHPDAPPSPLRPGRHIANGRCSPLRYNKQALPERLSKMVARADAMSAETQDSDTDSDDTYSDSETDESDEEL